MNTKFKNFSTKNIPIYGIFVAISIILGRIASIQIMPSVKIGFKFLATATAGFLFGPIPATIISVAEDLLGATLFPKGPFHPGFLFNTALSGFIYGFVLYKANPTPKLNSLENKKCFGFPINNFIRSFIACFMVGLVVNVLLNTYWMMPILGKSFGVLVYPRIISNLIQLPIKTIVVGMIISTLQKVPYVKHL